MIIVADFIHQFLALAKNQFFIIACFITLLIVALCQPGLDLVEFIAHNVAFINQQGGLNFNGPAEDKVFVLEGS